MQRPLPDAVSAVLSVGVAYLLAGVVQRLMPASAERPAVL